MKYLFSDLLSDFSVQGFIPASAQYSLRYSQLEPGGTAQGFCYNVGRGVSAIAPPLIGFLVGKYGFATGLTTVSVFAVAAAVVVLTLPETKGKALEIE